MERTTEFKLLAHNFLRDFDCSGEYIEQQMLILLQDIYVQGWEDGMSEGTEHAEQLRKYQEKYE